MSNRFVLDASAVVALAHGEPGADAVEPLVDGSSISSVNWSEVARICVTTGQRASALRTLLEDAGCEIVAFTAADAEAAAALWPETRRAGLSLADRSCLALARRLRATAVTADRAWRQLDVGVDIVSIR